VPPKNAQEEKYAAATDYEGIHDAREHAKQQIIPARRIPSATKRAQATKKYCTCRNATAADCGHDSHDRAHASDDVVTKGSYIVPEIKRTCNNLNCFSKERSRQGTSANAHGGGR